MQLKHLALISALVSSVAIATVSTVLAADTTPTATPSPGRISERLADVQARVDRRITRRVDALNRLIARVQNYTHLTANDQLVLLKEDQGAVAILKTFKTKIDAETTIAAVRTDVKQIPTFHVSDFILPQNRSLIAVSNLQYVATGVAGRLATVQKKIDALKTQGEDVGAMQTLLNDATTKLKASSVQLASDEATLAGLTPTSPNPGATFSQVRKDLGSVRTDLSDIRKDLAQIRSAAKALKRSATPRPTGTR